METKHTKGEWYVNKNMPGYGDSVCISRRNESDYWEDGHVKIIGDCPIAIVSSGHNSWENKYPAEANAKLIAAAPELLEALIELTDALKCEFGRDLTYLKAISAIKKATE